MTDVGRMSVAEPVGKVLADQVGSGHPVASAIVASPSSILGQTNIMRHAVAELLPGSASPALLHHHPRLDHDQGPCSLP